MFSATIHQFIKSSGAESLIPTPSLNQSDNVKLLQVVIKTNRKWPWQSAKFRPTEYNISQLLQKPKPEIQVNSDVRKLTTFHRETDFDLNGKFGLALMQEILDFKLGASYSVKITASLGEINKEEVDIPTLTSVLQTRYIVLIRMLHCS